MVLPGGGDLSTRVWASMRNKLYQIKKWRGKPAAESSAFKDAIWKLEQSPRLADSVLNMFGKILMKKKVCKPTPK